MAQNFTDSPSNGATQAFNGVTYTYNSSKAIWTAKTSAGILLTDLSVGSEPSASGDGAVAYNNATGVITYTPPVIGGSTTVYANTSNLPTTAAATTGDMAFVTANLRFYVFNGTAWYSVALTNTAPTVSGAASSYSLSTSGAATVVTLSASDPEGDPLTFSHTASGLVNEATITQGTGSNTNVFTVTPSTNNAHAGDFSVVFSATDGANVVNNTSSFTLVFSTPQHFSTALKVKTSGNNTRNNSVFDDSSTSNHTINVNSVAHQTTLTPYSYNWSNYFDGSGDYLTITDSADFDLATAWTFETWVYPENLGSGFNPFYQTGVDSSNGFVFDMSNGGSTPRFLYHTGSWVTLSSSSTISNNVWSHISVTWDGSYYKMFVNGVETASATSSTAITNPTTGVQIGRSTTSGGAQRYYKGYLTDTHFIKGYAKYTASFKAPLEKITAHSNTKLLTCRSNRFIDESTSSHAITIAGNTLISKKNPLAIVDVWKQDIGGSVYITGTGDNLRTPSTADFTFGTGDFSVSFWLNITGQPTSYASVIDFRGTSTRNDASSFTLVYSTSKMYIYASPTFHVDNIPRVLNRWQHMVYQRRTVGGTQSDEFYIDGVLFHQAADSTNWTQSNLWIGTSNWNDHGSFYLADLKINKGSAEYSGAFTPPTAPTSLESNTKLKLNFTQAGVFDSISKSSLQLVGNAQESTAQTKYATTSIAFDGTGDYTTSTDPSLNIRQGDFQVEFWAYRTSASGSEGFFHLSANPIGSSTNGIALYSDSNFKMWLYHNGYTDTGTLSPANQWNHHVVLRRNGRLQAFLNGTRHTNIASTHDFNGSTMNIGQMYTTGNTLTGYMEDFRYLQHHTTYPNERPQTALTAVSGTTLQFANASTIPSSANGLTVTATEGSPTVSSFTPPYSTVSHSIYYDGNDINSVAANTNIHLGTGDFTIEGHFYIVAFVGTYGALFGNRAAQNASGFGMSFTASNMYIYSLGMIINNIPFDYKKWFHLVYQRKTISGTATHQFFRDGVLIGEGTGARDYGNHPLNIGGDLGSSENSHMYVSDFRVIKGTAIYDKSFTPPTEAL